MSANEDIRLVRETLEAHIKDCDARYKEDKLVMEEFIKVQQINTDALNKLSGVITMWEAGKGVVTVGTAVAAIGKWFGGLAAGGIVIKWLYDHFV